MRTLDERRRAQFERTAKRQGYGKKVKVGQPTTTTTFDPETGESTNSLDWSDATEVSAFPPNSFRYDLVDGTLIQEGDAVIGVPASALDFEPTTSDKVRFDSETWQIIQVRPHWSGEKVALYGVHVRK